MKQRNLQPSSNLLTNLSKCVKFPVACEPRQIYGSCLCLEHKVNDPATKLRDRCEKWQRLPTCSSLEEMEDVYRDEDNSSDFPVHVP